MTRLVQAIKNLSYLEEANTSAIKALYKKLNNDFPHTKTFGIGLKGSDTIFVVTRKENHKKEVSDVKQAILQSDVKIKSEKTSDSKLPHKDQMMTTTNFVLEEVEPINEAKSKSYDIEVAYEAIQDVIDKLHLAAHKVKKAKPWNKELEKLKKEMKAEAKVVSEGYFSDLDIQMQEAVADPIAKIAELAKGKKLLDLGKDLGKLFGSKNVSLNTKFPMPVMYLITAGNKKVVVCNKKDCDSADKVVGDIAIGYLD
jgi:hypothetical protein